MFLSEFDCQVKIVILLWLISHHFTIFYHQRPTFNNSSSFQNCFLVKLYLLEGHHDRWLENWVTWLKPHTQWQWLGVSGAVIVWQLSSWKRHLPPFFVVVQSVLAPYAWEILQYKWKTKFVGRKMHFRSKSFSIVLVQGKHDSIIFQSNYIGTKNLKYWTRTVAGDSRRLVQLKHFSTVNVISGEFFKVPIPMLFPTGLSFVDSQLKGSGGLVSMEPSIACDSYDCYIINNSLSTTVCFSMLNFQLLTIKGSSFLKKEMVAEVLSSFFFLSASCSLQDMTQLFSCQQHIV